MKHIIIVISILLTGCIDTNCYDTDIVDYYKTTETLYYTITEPVYLQECT